MTSFMVKILKFCIWTMAWELRTILVIQKIKMWIISYSQDKEYIFPPYPNYSLNILDVGLVWWHWDLMFIGTHESKRKMLSPKTLGFFLRLWPIPCEPSM